MPIVGRADQKKAKLLLARHAPTPPKRSGTMLALPRPSLPRKTRRPLFGDSSAGVRQAVRDIRWQHLAVLNYCSFSSFLFFDHTGCHSVYDAIDVIVCSGDVASTLLQSSQLYRRPIHAENKPA